MSFTQRSQLNSRFPQISQINTQISQMQELAIFLRRAVRMKLIVGRGRVPDRSDWSI